MSFIHYIFVAYYNYIYYTHLYNNLYNNESYRYNNDDPINHWRTFSWYGIF